VTEAPHRVESILFVCTMNSVRSPIAEGVAKSVLGHRLFIDSAGLKKTARDPFALAVLGEIGIEFADDEAHCLDDVDVEGFDVIVTLSREAREVVEARLRAVSARHLHWPVDDPTLTVGSRETRLSAYRTVREKIRTHIRSELLPMVKAGRPN